MAHERVPYGIITSGSGADIGSKKFDRLEIVCNGQCRLYHIEKGLVEKLQDTDVLEGIDEYIHDIRNLISIHIAVDTETGVIQPV